MTGAWRDGARSREVEVHALGAERWRVRIDGAELEVEARPLGDGRLELISAQGRVSAQITAVGTRRFVRLGSLEFVLERETSARARGPSSAGEGGLDAPMSGAVTRVLVAPGDEVTQGQPLVAVEAMKMEHLVRAPRAGRVKRVHAAPGDTVAPGVALVELEATSGG